MSYHLCQGQYSRQLSDKVSVSVAPNIETYFFAEKLAVEHIGNYVFSNNTTDFYFQPVVRFGFERFKPFKDSPVIMRIAAILKQLQPILHDNAQELEYLLYLEPFPKVGLRYPATKISLFDDKRYPGAGPLALELTDSLRSFYRQAKVAGFLAENKRFYEGALTEVVKYVDPKIFPAMEHYYGKHFIAYHFYLMPGMPVTPGEDNYRAFGPTIITPGGEIAAMVMSSSKMLERKAAMAEYTTFGYDNREVVHLLTVHEIGHSFVNPALQPYTAQLNRDSALFTPAFAKKLKSSYIERWETCVIEHLVRLGEIRTAHILKNYREEQRLRRLHIGQFGFVLIPFLEKQILRYEANRKTYKSFENFLPEILKSLHGLKPADIDRLVAGK